MSTIVHQQVYGIPPDIQYYLDCSIECFNITPDIYLWARWFCPNIAALIDGFDSNPEIRQDSGTNHGDFLVRSCQELEREYVQWQETAPWQERAICLAYGVQSAPNLERVEQEVLHTIMHLRRPSHLEFELDNVPSYREARAYGDNRAVYYRVEDRMQVFDHHFQMLARMWRQWDELESHDFSDFTVLRAPRPTREQLLASIGRDEEPWTDDGRPLQSRKPRTIPHDQRKAIRRSMSLFDRIAGEGTSKLYLSNKEIVVTGNRYEFKLTKQSSLQNSHGACRTEVWDRAENAFVASLCVYTPNVTVFDHMVSIVLHCTSGMEETILEESNIIQCGREDLLPESIRKKREAQREFGRNYAERNGMQVIEHRTSMGLLERQRKYRAKAKRRFAELARTRYGLTSAQHKPAPVMQLIGY